MLITTHFPAISDKTIKGDRGRLLFFQAQREQCGLPFPVMTRTGVALPPPNASPATS